MTDTALYQIGDFEFNIVTGRLRRFDDPDGVLLTEQEAKLLTFLIHNFEKASRIYELKKEYKEQLVDYVWDFEAVTDDALTKLAQFLRKRFGSEGHEYILADPCRLARKPIVIDKPLTGPSSIDRREFLIEASLGLGIAAAFRRGRCHVSLSLKQEGGHSRLTLELSEPDLLAWYFFPLSNHGDDSDDRVALMVGTNDKYDPISPRKWSESGRWVASHYINAFRTGNVEPVDDLGHLRDEDALVLVGSNEVNPKARDYMGDPQTHEPTHRIQGKAARAIGYEAEMPFSIFTPEAAREVHIQQTREEKSVLRKTKEHIISCLDGEALRSRSGKSGDRDIWLTDYLLVTALPTDATEQRRVISFAGLHRTGTLAAGNLVSENENASEILTKMDRILKGSRYFQALISLDVDNSLSDRGRAQPGEFTDVIVAPISITKLLRKK